ncbi:MAG: hypothetical protein K9N55_03425 [Phycisphaerae bacterium]|nr:hypothetical protein [Phycisphaerae bacterium]
MNTILPVIIVLSLGAGFGLLLKRWLPNSLVTSIVAGILATVTWGIIMEIMFRMVDFEEERGGTLYHVIFMVFLSAFTASLAALTLSYFANKKHD